MLKKLQLLFFSFFIAFVVLSKANATTSISIDDIIKNSELNKSSIVSVSIRDVKTADVIYEKNQNLLLKPASTLKAFVSFFALNYLGKNYEFKTAIYEKFEKNKLDLYLKLSGDPLFDEKSLLSLVSQLKMKEIKNIDNLYVDDSVMDSKTWGEGWMWDDNTSFYMPQISPYNINHNLVKVALGLDKDKKVSVSVFPSFPMVIATALGVGDKTEMEVSRDVFKQPSPLFIKGKISEPIGLLIPVTDPQNYFLYRLTDMITQYGIPFNPDIKKAKTPAFLEEVASVSTKILGLLPVMIQNSDNLIAETLLKHAGAKASGQPGTTTAGLKAMLGFYNKIGVDTSGLKLVDASGASHYNLINSDWMTLALSKISKFSGFDYYLTTLAAPGKNGTLQNRMIDLQDVLRAKTGTLSAMSSITGYLTTKTGKKVCFAILIQNFKGSSDQAKALEDEIIHTTYVNY